MYGIYSTQVFHRLHELYLLYSLSKEGSRVTTQYISYVLYIRVVDLS